MKSILQLGLMSVLYLFLSSCSSNNSSDNKEVGNPTSLESPATAELDQKQESLSQSLVLIPGGLFQMGATDEQGRPDEYPLHWVKVSSFYMSKHEITNAQFREFVDATGYVTIAEQDVDWEEMKKQVPPGTPKPDESLLKAGSLIFSPPSHAVDLRDFTQWWSWKTGADWKHPQGPGSTIVGKDDHPVVQVCWFDAVAYCEWAGVRLPTEAEWEWAARSGKQEVIYAWGNEHVNSGDHKANSWQGHFPDNNTSQDGFEATAPVGSFEPNEFGLYDMSGNVWEWCSDWYRADEYQKWNNDTLVNPQGPSESWDPRDPYGQKRSQRGGSYLCNEEYCSSYRVSARMPGSNDTGMPHVGFRVVKDPD
jgi:sulfatase modifying factor 1